MGSPSLQKLAESYCENPAAGLRNAIISKSMPLIRSIIGKINSPDKPLTQREDLESAGISGLLQAMDSYDSDRNIQFNTYVYYRIRGNIIDYLRKIDRLPRQKRKNYGQVKQVMQQLSQKLGRTPSDQEVAEEIGMNLEDYHELLSNVQTRNALSLDKPFNDNNGANTFYEVHADTEAPSPDQDLEKKELATALQHKIGELPERDRLILTLYYYEDMTMNEVALLLELSEARISQIVGKLLIKLRQELVSEELV